MGPQFRGSVVCPSHAGDVNLKEVRRRRLLPESFRDIFVKLGWLEKKRTWGDIFLSTPAKIIYGVVVVVGGALGFYCCVPSGGKNKKKEKKKDKNNKNKNKTKG